MWTIEGRAKSNEKAIENAIAKHLVEDSTCSTEHIKIFLYRDFGYRHQCVNCGISDWNGKHITLELDHVNGNNKDNRLQNLELLCPNCHSQTPTWRGRNMNTGMIKVTDDELIAALKEEKNIRQALLAVGLAAKGDNYKRANKLLLCIA